MRIGIGISFSIVGKPEKYLELCFSNRSQQLFQD